MSQIIEITLIVTFLGAISSGIGGFICFILNIKNKKYISALQEITAGIMTGIVCFDMLPETFHITNVWIGVIGVIIGIVLIHLLDKIILRYNCNESKTYVISIIIMLSMGFHNFIEGIAIGSSFSYSFAMGLTVIIAIILHDIPEGIVVGLSNKIAGENNIKNMFNTILVGGITGIGAIIGQLIGNISDECIGIALSISSGVMLYIVACELIPNSYEESKDKVISISYIIGILIGALIVYM